jgi:hypothetical protein
LLKQNPARTRRDYRSAPPASAFMDDDQFLQDNTYPGDASGAEIRGSGFSWADTGGGCSFARIAVVPLVSDHIRSPGILPRIERPYHSSPGSTT